MGRLALFVVTAVVWVFPHPAPATGTPTTAYWWRGQTGVGPLLPPPPVVPADGGWVARDPSGDHAVTAVRVTVAETETVTALTFPVSDTVGTAIVVACPTFSMWEPVAGGAWDARPGADCSVGVTGVPAPDGKALRFDLTETKSLADLLLVPRGDAGPFSVILGKPEVSRAPRESTTGPSDDGAAFEEFTTLTTPTTTFTAAPVDPLPTTQFAVPQVSVPVERPPAVAAPAEPPKMLLRPARQEAPSPTGRRELRLLVPLALLMAVWVWRGATVDRAFAGHELARPLRASTEALGSGARIAVAGDER